MHQVSKPFFAILHKWLFSGELNDPFSEFFVAVDPELAHLQYVQQSSSTGQLTGDGGFSGLGGDAEDLSSERDGGLKLWEGKYRFQKDMLPLFVGETFGRKVGFPLLLHNMLIRTNENQIFSTGKSLNFIRYSCRDSDWVATRENLSDTGGSMYRRPFERQYSD